MPGTNSYDKDYKGFARKLFILYVHNLLFWHSCKTKLNYDLISMSLKSNYYVTICTSVSYFL